MANPLSAQVSVEVPSGQPVILTEVLIDDAPGELWARFRFVAPEIARDGGSVGYQTASGDIDHLCQALALPYLAEHSLTVAKVVISLSDRDVPFGVSDSEATQFFEAYTADGPDCILEPY